jgi:gas vesicle protein
MFNERDHGFSTGMMVGALLGAGLALLFAPKPGAELREDLSGSMSSVRDAVARRYRALAERAGVEIENLEARVDQAAEAVESTARGIMESASQQRRRRVAG